MKLLEGIERKERWLFMESSSGNLVALDSPTINPKFGPQLTSVIDSAYVKRLELMLAKAVEQRNYYLEEYVLCNSTEEKNRDAELRAIAEGK